MRKAVKQNDKAKTVQKARDWLIARGLPIEEDAWKSILTVYTPLGVVVLVQHANTGTARRPPDQRGCLYWIGVVKVCEGAYKRQ